MYKTIIVLLIITITLYFLFIGSSNDIKWSSKASKEYGSYAPSERINDVIKEFGKPSMMDPREGGGAVWFKKDLGNKPYEIVAIYDEAIPHNKPAKHADFLYTWVKLKVPLSKLTSILSLSKSVAYDPLKELLQVRCHFMGANKATIVLAIRIATGKLSLSEIRKNKLYAKYIFKTVKGHSLYDPKAEEKYEKEINTYINNLRG